MKIKGNYSASSRAWLNRQMKDPFVLQSKKDGYRARSAYKLIEIDEKYHILENASRILDLGAAPGGWSQVISRKITQQKLKAEKLVSVDLLSFDPLPHVTQIIGDFSQLETQAKIIAEFGDQKPDLIISDMAPSTTGNRTTDHLKIMSILYDVYEFVVQNLCMHGSFAAKIFLGGEENDYIKLLRKHFKKVVFFKPKSSRSESVEMFIVALDRQV